MTCSEDAADCEVVREEPGREALGSTLNCHLSGRVVWILVGEDVQKRKEIREEILKILTLAYSLLFPRKVGQKHHKLVMRLRLLDNSITFVLKFNPLLICEFALLFTSPGSNAILELITEWDRL